MPPPADIVKVAIEWPGANAQLIEMDQVCVCVKCDIKIHLQVASNNSNFCQLLVAKPLESNLITEGRNYANNA